MEINLSSKIAYAGRIKQVVNSEVYHLHNNGLPTLFNGLAKLVAGKSKSNVAVIPKYLIFYGLNDASVTVDATWDTFSKAAKAVSNPKGVEITKRYIPEGAIDKVVIELATTIGASMQDKTTPIHAVAVYSEKNEPLAWYKFVDAKSAWNPISVSKSSDYDEIILKWTMDFSNITNDTISGGADT